MGSCGACPLLGIGYLDILVRWGVESGHSVETENRHLVVLHRPKCVLPLDIF